MKNFEIQWKALKAKKEEDVPDVPKISKSLPVIKWTEAFQDFLARVIGVRTIPLSYVIRQVVEVNNPPPVRATDQPHSTRHGSVEGELIARAPHNHALFRDDNASVYHYLEEATRTTFYAASIKPFQRSKNGRGAWLALVGQYAGRDKWEAEIKRQEQLLHTRVWKGQSNFSLESFISQHRNAFVSMQQCAEHVQYQLPNEHSRVGFLLEAIQCSDAGLQAAMASVKTDNGPNGMRNDFEAAAAHLLPYDPVAKKRSSATKRDHSVISDVQGEVNVSGVDGKTKASIGKSGVHLRWHTKKEYSKLTGPQKKELYEWREANPDEGPKHEDKKRKVSFSTKQINALVSKRAKKELQKLADEEKKQEDGEAYIMSLVEKCRLSSASTASATASTPSPPLVPTRETQYDSTAIRSILKRARAKQG